MEERLLFFLCNHLLQYWYAYINKCSEFGLTTPAERWQPTLQNSKCLFEKRSLNVTVSEVQKYY